MNYSKLLLLCCFLSLPQVVAAQDRIRVVTTLPTYAAIAREVAGDLADVEAIARGDVDPHFVTPRPSFAAMIRRADLFVTTGLDLELWVPALLDRANNSRVLEGGVGHVAAYSGVNLLEVPQSVSRMGGDVHVFGNPHIHTDPINAVQIAANIATGLKRVDPINADIYDARLADFRDRLVVRMFGDSLTEMLGAATLYDLARGRSFWNFVSGRSFGGRPLADYLGGWLADAAPFRGGRMVCYHKNWAYFTARFQVECSMYVERKPGIPPSPRHVRDVVDFIRSSDIGVIFAANHYGRGKVDRVGSRTGAAVVMVPFHEEGEEGVDSYFDLVDIWVSRLAQAFTDHSAARASRD